MNYNEESSKQGEDIWAATNSDLSLRACGRYPVLWVTLPGDHPI